MSNNFHTLNKWEIKLPKTRNNIYIGIGIETAMKKTLILIVISFCVIVVYMKKNHWTLKDGDKKAAALEISQKMSKPQQ